MNEFIFCFIFCRLHPGGYTRETQIRGTVGSPESCPKSVPGHYTRRPCARRYTAHVNHAHLMYNTPFFIHRNDLWSERCDIGPMHKPQNVQNLHMNVACQYRNGNFIARGRNRCQIIGKNGKRSFRFSARMKLFPSFCIWRGFCMVFLDFWFKFMPELLHLFAIDIPTLY